MSERRSTWISIGLICLLALPLFSLRERGAAHYEAAQRYEDIYYLPTADSLPYFSLGYREALANLIWIRGLIYFGEELQNRGDVSHIFRYAQAVLTLDQHFTRVYRWVASTSLYRPGEIQVDDIEQALTFLERGVELNPNDAELLWDLGATLSYELAPRVEDDLERKEELKRRGSVYLLRAARLGAGPPWVALSNASQLMRLGQNEQAIRHLEEMYGVVRDDEVRQQIAQRIGMLRSEGHAEALRLAHESFEARRLRDYPYLPPTLFLILGSPPDAATGAEEASSEEGAP